MSLCVGDKDEDFKESLFCSKDNGTLVIDSLLGHSGSSFEYQISQTDLDAFPSFEIEVHQNQRLSIPGSDLFYRDDEVSKEKKIYF